MSALSVILPEKLNVLVQRKQNENDVSFVEHVIDRNGNAHLLMKENKTESHIVWTAFDTKEPITTYSDFYNGSYDLTCTAGQQELARRCYLS